MKSITYFRVVINTPIRATRANYGAVDKGDKKVQAAKQLAEIQTQKKPPALAS